MCFPIWLIDFPFDFFFFLRVLNLFFCALRKLYLDWAPENLSHGVPRHAPLSMTHPWIDLTPAHLKQIWSRRVSTRRNRNAITIQSIAGMTRMEQNGRELSRGVDQAHEVLNFVGLKFCVGLRRRYCFFALTGWFRQAAFRFEKINAPKKIFSREKNHKQIHQCGFLPQR